VNAMVLAALTSCAAPLLILIVYAPALQAPFLVPKFAALEVLGSLGVVSFFWQRAVTGKPRWTRPLTVGVWLVLATSLVSWAAAARGTAGAPYALDAVARFVACLGLACASSVIADTPDARQRVLEAVTMAAAAVAAIGLLQHIDWLPLAMPVISTPGSTFGNRNFAAEAMAMALPLGVGAAVGARGSGARAVGVVMWTSLGVEVVFLAVTRTRGAWLGAAFGLATVVALRRQQLRGAALWVGLGAIVVAAVATSVPVRRNPRDVGDAKRYSGVVEVLEEGFDTRSMALRSRLGLWRRTVAMIAEHPMLGVGPGNWPVVFPLYAEPGAARDGVLSANRAPRQAHNDVLERAAETGTLGLLAALSLALGAATAARARLTAGDEDARMVSAAATGTLAALVALSAASFPFDMPGTLALAGLSLGLIVTDAAAPPRREAARLTFAAAASAVFVVAGALVRAERSVRGSLWLGAAERSISADSGPRGAALALSSLDRALRAEPGDYRAHLRTAQMLLRTGRPLDSCLATRRALAVEPYSPNAWAALALAELVSRDAAAAKRDSTQALSLLADFPLALHVRARAEDSLGDESSALADRERMKALATGSTDPDTSRAARSLLDGS
jgi:O-antigen ligase